MEQIEEALQNKNIDLGIIERQSQRNLFNTPNF